MKTSETVEQLFKAFVNASKKLQNTPKDSKGYSYTYTSLEKLIEATKPILADNGLAIMQFPTGNGIITRMIHESGEWIEQETNSELIQLKGMNAYQVQGSQVTYLRRYAWAAICGIASDEDKDAAGEEVKQQQPAKVNAKQVKLIQTLISKKRIDDDTVSMLKSHYNIESWNDLPAAAMDGLMQWFNKKPDIVVE